MHLVHLVVLGAAGVGKTTLIENFLSSRVLPLEPASGVVCPEDTKGVTTCQTPTGSVKQNQSTQHYPSVSHSHSSHSQHHPPVTPTSSSSISSSREVYSFSVLLNDQIYQIRVADMSAIPYFPLNSQQEFSDFRGTSLRSADGYILMFDLTSPATFQYLKVIREQLFESRNMQKIPVFIVGNKIDCLLTHLSTHSQKHHHPHLPHHPSIGGHEHHLHSHHHHSHHHEHPPSLKDLAAMVKKQWKSSYWEISSLYNWRVESLFLSMIKLIESNIIAEQTAHPHLYHHHHRKGSEDPHHQDSVHRGVLQSGASTPPHLMSQRITTTLTSTLQPPTQTSLSSTQPESSTTPSCHIM